MKQLFDEASVACSRVITRKYSTSFSLGISLLASKFHAPVYAIYGFVRLADEIVDSFHEHDKERLLADFKSDTEKAIREKISINPVLHAFQDVVHRYHIDRSLISQFLRSMTMDLRKQEYNSENYKEYVLGSAEVVGLMCLKVFTEGRSEEYERLKSAAMMLGSAFQKVNFLRDLGADYHQLGRSYFPGIDLSRFSNEDKIRIEQEIEAEFEQAIKGIRMLPAGARCGVYLAYMYYKKLFQKIKGLPAVHVMNSRVRISNGRKFGLIVNSVVRHNFNLL